ncbi:RagB/SusD family protein [Paraflavisolibacter sp. H34]|uniref:RagB/SusD family nutrient uptake outer membrane protein n=1 Tax=Huijunlia imazamoxiresistens TaxID=3127457 RepID=UPI00301866A4
MKLFSIKNILLAALLAGAASCKKSFDYLPATELDAEQMYRNVYDADAAVMGIYGKFMGLADRYVILNELRGDLLTTTANADAALRELNAHQVSAGNPYASPLPFYELILNCNDVLKNFLQMKEKNALKEAEFNQRYSDIAALRAFLYLQLGIHYGDEVVYVTDPLENRESLRERGRFPKLTFEVLLDSLIASTEPLPFKEPYPAGTSLNITLDGAPTSFLFINKKILLGDLYLWKGDYTRAATYYREVMETSSPEPISENKFQQYKIGWGDVNHGIGYTKAGDATTLNFADGWRRIFDRPYDNGYRREWIWALPYDSKFQPENPLIRLFSPIGGDYLVKPSQESLDKWNSQVQNTVALAGNDGGLPYDARGPLSVRSIGGQPVVMKYLYNYLDYNTNLPTNPLVKNGKWWLFRQTHLHLRFAEAANRAGHHRLAYAFFNRGIATTYAPPAGVTNVTDYMNTLHLPAPFNFDARVGEIPYYRSDWNRNVGIRVRANLVPYALSGSDSLVQVEDGLLQESALENAFEGTRWADLLRIARRRAEPSLLADAVYNKLQKEGHPAAAAVRKRLLDPKNWYLPFQW